MDELESYHWITNATKDSIKSANQTDKISKEVRLRLVNFWYNVAIFSGSSIVLSITFLGYLKSNPDNIIKQDWILVVAWFLLLICLIAALYRNYKHTAYMHYYALTDYCEKQKKVVGTQLNAIKANPELIYNKLDLGQYIKTQSENLLTYEESVGINKSRKKSAQKYLKSLQFIGHFGFILGLIALVIFAVINLV